jgi:hypothetical protein
MVFECCVSNHAQGWPKWAARQLATVAPSASSGGRAGVALVYFFDATTKALLLEDGNVVSLTVVTRYPFAPNITVIINASRSFPLSIRIPAWSKSNVITVNGEQRQQRLLNGTMTVVEVPAGNGTRVQLSLELKIRIERQLPYILTKNRSWDSNAATVHRGPLLFAVPRDFVIDHSKPFDEAPDLLPVGQAHGRNNFLLGTGNWTLALRVSDDNNLRSELEYVDLDVPTPPKGQGIFSPFLVPGGIRAKAQVLPLGAWQAVQTDAYLDGRGAAYTCTNGTSIKNYRCQWSGLAPRSPVQHALETDLVDVLMLPYGATDLRVAELPTVQTKLKTDDITSSSSSGSSMSSLVSPRCQVGLADCTTALQASLNRSGTIVVGLRTSAGMQTWPTRPLYLRSHTHITFLPGTEVTAMAGEFHGGGDCLFAAIPDPHDVSNVTIVGWGATWRMRRADYADNRTYTHSEWRAGLVLTHASDIHIVGLTITDTGGDGIYIIRSRNLLIDSVVLERCYRQGLSVIAATDMLVTNSTFSNTGQGTVNATGAQLGTPPMCGE